MEIKKHITRHKNGSALAGPFLKGMVGIFRKLFKGGLLRFDP